MKMLKYTLLATVVAALIVLSIYGARRAWVAAGADITVRDELSRQVMQNQVHMYRSITNNTALLERLVAEIRAHHNWSTNLSDLGSYKMKIESSPATSAE